MIDSINPFDALDLVPGWNPDISDVEELKGGLTNRTFYVRQDDRQCVLRIDSEASSLFEFDRAGELVALESASRAGIAPAVIFADPEAGILVTEFVEGRVWDEPDLESSENLEALGSLLREVHALPETGHRLDMSQVARLYESNLQKRQGLHAFATRCVEIIDSIPASAQSTCCHNDIVAANVIAGDRLRLIDWEFSCDNDPLFDLASAIGFHNLDSERAAILLSAYLGGSDPALSEQLEEQIRVFDAIQWLWLATRHLVYPRRWQARRLEVLQQRIR